MIFAVQIIALVFDGLTGGETPIAHIGNIGKTVFLTKEEAEAKLKELGDK